MGADGLFEAVQVFSVTSRRDGGRVVVELVGELDLAGSDRLTSEVASALREPAEAVEIDAAGLTYADSSGLRSLLDARAVAAEIGAAFRFSAVSPELRRILEISGLTMLLLRPLPRAT
jgi:anti-anti-sigma factor